MSHTPMCKTCGARHFNFDACPSRRGSLVMPGNSGTPWGTEPLPEGVKLNGAVPWKATKTADNVRHLPRVPQDFGPRAA